MSERTAAIGSKTEAVTQGFMLKKLRDNLNTADIKFAENRLTLTMTTINVKYSDFDNASKIIADTGFEILN